MFVEIVQNTESAFDLTGEYENALSDFYCATMVFIVKARRYIESGFSKSTEAFSAGL